MQFRKYQHLERFGTSEVQDIELGECYVFPKLDGTNASVWLDSWGHIQAGSRNRTLSIDNDNAGFLNWILNQQNILDYLRENPTHRLYGEWLVPHSLKTYKETAWRNFYVFDVLDESKVTETTSGYLCYTDYKDSLDSFNITYIPPISILTNASADQFTWQLKNNVFMIEDGKGAGEGIVIKNYGFVNRYGRQTWAKIVTTEFKEKHSREMGPNEIKGKRMVEQEIVQKFVTTALCEKVLAKIELEEDGFSSKLIPKLLHIIYYDVVREDCWNFVKMFKDPIIDFKKLKALVFAQVKINLPNYF